MFCATEYVKHDRTPAQQARMKVRKRTITIEPSAGSSTAVLLHKDNPRFKIKLPSIVLDTAGATKILMNVVDK